MKQSFLAAAIVISASSAALAIDTPLSNGSFEQNGTPGFTQTINNWSVAFSGTQSTALTGQQSGLFSSYGKFNATNVPNGSVFVLLTNTGSGTVTMTSSAAAGAPNFAVVDRALQFRYAYMTNDPPAGGARDQFRVHVDFFASATSTTVIGSIDRLIADQGTLTDSNVGVSPFGGVNNNAPATYNDATRTGTNTFNLVSLDISQFFGTFARVSFIVDNGGPAPGATNGLGVSGIVLDQVVLNPEPSTIALFALGVAGLGGFAWKRRRAPLAAVRA
jgi:hypothetical protein